MEQREKESKIYCPKNIPQGKKGVTWQLVIP